MQQQNDTRRHLGHHPALVLGIALALGTTGATAWQPAATGQHRQSAATAARNLSSAPPANDAMTPFSEVQIFALTGITPHATAATRVVTNCNDSGAGSLRNVLAFAADGDTIDMSGLNCNISLNTSIITGLDDVTLKGNASALVGIDGQDQWGVVHIGTGTLTLDNMMILGGQSTTTAPGIAAKGGCVSSNGHVWLKNGSRVKYCFAEHTGSGVNDAARGGAIFSAGMTILQDNSIVSEGRARTNGGTASGGGIYAGGGVFLYDSSVTNSEAEATSGIVARGGGIASRGNLKVFDSTISSNTTATPGGGIAFGGGAWGAGTSNVIFGSTIDNNEAKTGAALVLGVTSGTVTTMTQVTIADNFASSSGKYGGAIFLGGEALVRNSTISGNVEQNATDTKYGAGLKVAEDADVTLSSNILSGNVQLRQDTTTYGSDLFGKNGSTTVIAGDHNLIGWSQFVTTPADTIIWGDPRVMPLAWNGGGTRTMALRSDSKAIDAGVANGQTRDQRGAGFPRAQHGAVDIGAFELDLIFADGFEGPPS